jgi:hypothetical protein
MTTATQSTPVAEKVSPDDRRAAANSSFQAGADPTQVAALFAVVPNGREYLDVTYNARAAALMQQVIDGTLPATDLSDAVTPFAELRDAVLAALPQGTAKAERVIDPAEVRSALVEKIASLTAIACFLTDAGTYANDLLPQVDDLTDDELELINAATAPKSVIDAGEKLRKVIDGLVSDKVQGTRTKVNHVTPAPGTVLTKGNKGTGVHVEVIGAADGVAYKLLTTGETFDAISTVAAAIAGGQRNGWTFFGLE